MSGINTPISKAVLTRQESDDNGTFGTLFMAGFSCFTGELPDRNNHPDTSCIPKGTYVCKWTHSPRLNRSTYEVIDVPQRDGIRIHSANYPEQLLGCIALGRTKEVINGKKGIFSSKDAVKQFEDLMNQQDFTLEIV